MLLSWSRRGPPWPLGGFQRCQSVRVGFSSDDGLPVEIGTAMASLVAQMVKNLPCNVGEPGSIPGWGRSWRRKWQTTPVFLPGKSRGQRSLAGYSPWGHREADTTEQLNSIVDPAMLTCKIIKASHFSCIAYFALAKSHTQPIHLNVC